MEALTQPLTQLAGSFGPTADTWEVVLGVILASTGCLFATIGNILMKKDSLKWAHIPLDEQPSLITRPYVLLAICSYLFNAIFDFSALAFITISVDGCATALSIPLNALLAYFFLDEVMTKKQWFSCSIILSAALVAVLQGSHESGDKSIEDIKHLWIEKVWIYFAIFVVCFQIFLGSIVYRHVQKVHSDNLAQLQAEEADLHATPLKRNYSWETADSAAAAITVTSEPNERPQSSSSPYNDSLQPETDLDTEGHETERLLSSGLNPVLTDKSLTLDGETADDNLIPSKRTLSFDEKPPVHTPVSPFVNNPVGQKYGYYYLLTVMVSSTMVGAIQSSWTNLFAKCGITLIRQLFRPGSQVYRNILLYVFVGSTVGSAMFQLMFLSWVMICFESVAAIPIYQCFYILWMQIFASVFFKEVPEHKFFFGLAVAIACTGILFMIPSDGGGVSKIKRKTSDVRSPHIQ